MASLIMNFKQIFLLIKRSYTAAVIRVPFNGTTRFKLPHSYFLKGTKISLNAPSEPGLAYDFINLLLDDEYGLKSIKNHPKTIVDIGANIGLFSQMAGELFPEAKIHAYEPNPRLQKYLDQNLKKVGVEFFPEAVGAFSGMGHSLETGDSRTGIFQKGGNTPIVAFSTVVERIGGEIDLLKLDCEGGEWDIFENAVPFQKVRIIRMEYHLVDGKSLQDLKSAADRIGFRIIKLVENSGFGIAWMESRSARG